MRQTGIPGSCGFVKKATGSPVLRSNWRMAGKSENRQVFLGDGRSAVLSGNEKAPTGGLSLDAVWIKLCCYFKVLGVHRLNVCFQFLVTHDNVFFQPVAQKVKNFNDIDFVILGTGPFESDNFRGHRKMLLAMFIKGRILCISHDFFFSCKMRLDVILQFFKDLRYNYLAFLGHHRIWQLINDTHQVAVLSIILSNTNLVAFLPEK